MKKTAVIIGAGPAGLAAALELTDRSDIRPVVLEMTDAIGGISRTVCHDGNRIDIGGHRFFSKIGRVNRFWERLMPEQDSPARDELLIGEGTRVNDARFDPETEDNVMLRRRRVSRIYYLRKFFDYPISVSLGLFRSLGLRNVMKAGLGYIASCIRKRPEKSLEDFYINRFGRPLYSMFFEDYTEKVWGLHPSRLGADWGSQRVKGLSVMAILRDILMKTAHRKKDSANVETSLIEEFRYPKYGPGQLWERAAEVAVGQGAEVIRNARVAKVNVDGTGNVKSVTVVRDGRETLIECDYLISSMPLKDLVASFDGIDVPEDVRRYASALPYRDFMTVGLLVDKLKIRNETKLKTYAGRIPDTWIYVQERDVRLGRIQVFNNWSPYMVHDFENTVWIGLEYFCNEGDEMWNMTDDRFIDLAKKEIEAIGILDAADVKDAVRIRMPKAYPAYHGAYYHLDTVRTFLDGIGNLYCVGRNGQHRYNNMDHSVLTAMKAVDTILDPAAAKSANPDKTAIWEVNTEKDYHETAAGGE